MLFLVPPWFISKPRSMAHSHSSGLSQPWASALRKKGDVDGADCPVGRPVPVGAGRPRGRQSRTLLLMRVPNGPDIDAQSVSRW